MTGAPARYDLATLKDYLSVIWRHKLLVLIVIVVVPAVTVVLTRRERTTYRASASVLLGSQSLGQALLGIPSVSQPIASQAQVAREAILAERVVKEAGLPATSAGAFLAESSVSADPIAYELTFTVTAHTSSLAIRLADAYADQFAALRRQLDLQSLRQTERLIETRLSTLRASGSSRESLALATTLEGKLSFLQTAENLQDLSRLVVQSTNTSEALAPHTTRNGALGLAVAILAALGLVFFREALETRVRGANEMGESIGLPILGRIETQGRHVGRRKLVMLSRPSSSIAESYRMLRSRIELSDFYRGADERETRILLVTSAVAGEGKSTVAANLAIAFARGGNRVVLVDVDLRRPSLRQFFHLPRGAGFSDVATGAAQLDDVVHPIVLGEAKAGPSNGNGHGQVDAFLEIITAGSVPAGVGEFVRSKGVSGVLEELRTRADVVILDTPPLLQVADALELSSMSDGILLVTQIGIVKRAMIADLERVLDSSPAAKLGVVVVGNDLAGGTSDYSYHYPHYAPQPARARREPTPHR